MNLGIMEPDTNMFLTYNALQANDVGRSTDVLQQ
jgi:hypothetical protein